MKRILQLLLVSLSLCTFSTAQTTAPLNVPTKNWAIENPEDYRNAGQDAIKQLIQDFMRVENLGSTSFSIFPIVNDAPGNYLTQLARNEFVEQGRPQGLKLFTRNDSVISDLMEEVKWGQQFGDIMDPATIQKFGKINGVECVLIGRVNAAEQDGDTVRVRVNLQAFNVETTGMIWGKELVGTVSPPVIEFEPESFVEIPGDGKSRFWAMVIGGGVLLFLVACMIFMISMKSSRRPR